VVRQSIHDTIEHQQREFLEGRDQPSTEGFDLSRCLAEVCQEFSRWSQDGRILVDQTGIQPGIVVVNHRIQIKNGIVNLLKNAFESIGSGSGRIVVSLERAGENSRARIAIEDDGAGVDPIDQGKLFRAGFTTKPWGHGLGLHSLAVFLSSNGGSVSLTSAGAGAGAKVVMEVGNV
jgi:signal transduction histidine kinase